MRIAVSGTHFMGKSRCIGDFIKKYPAYLSEIEPYYQLLDEKTVMPSLEPDLDSILEQLGRFIKGDRVQLATMLAGCETEITCHAAL